MHILKKKLIVYGSIAWIEIHNVILIANMSLENTEVAFYKDWQQA